MAMGNSSASNYAQSFGWFLVRRVLDRLETEEVVEWCQLAERRRQGENLSQKELVLLDWIQSRHILTESTGSPQARIYDVRQYTDDPVGYTVGTHRFIKLLATWRREMKAINLILAPNKGEIGVLTWLGHHHFPTDGVLVIQEAKALRACDVLRRGLAGDCTVEEWVNNNQLLQHLLVLRANDRKAMYGLWNAVHGYASNQKIPRPALVAQRGNIETWIQRLLETPAVQYAAACSPPSTPEIPRRAFTIYTDAAGNDCPSPGLGGFLGGFYWALPLEPSDVDGPTKIGIANLELAAVGVAFIVAAEHVRGAPTRLCSDSSTSVNVAHNDAAHTDLMQHTHTLITSLPEYHQLTEHGLYAGHVWGDGNPFGDLPSRGRFAELEALCRHLGITPRRLPVPQRARDLMASVRAFAQRHPSR